MIVKFRNNKLEKEYISFAKASKAYGQVVARKYIERVGFINDAQSIEELQLFPGLNCHKLSGVRMGQWAIKLTQRYRLIFTLEGEELNIVRIEEVSNHYDD